MYDYDTRTHECFNCRKENEYVIEKRKQNYECTVYQSNVKVLEPIYVDSNKVEVTYTCKKCNCINKVVVEL